MIFHFTTEALRSQRKIESSECIARRKHPSFFVPSCLCVPTILKKLNTKTQRHEDKDTQRKKVKMYSSSLSHCSHISSVISVPLWFILMSCR